MEVDYDIEKEMENLEKKSDKILMKYPDLDDLGDILDLTLSLIDSKSFNTLTKNIVNYVENFNNDMWVELDTESILKGNIDSIDKEFHVVKYSGILKDSQGISYLLNPWSDTIVFTHLITFVEFNIGILLMKKEKEITYKEIFGLTNKIMRSLDNFDSDMSFDIIDEDFFKSLKAIKWDKKANKLFEKILSIQTDIIDLIIKTLFSEIVRKSAYLYRFTLIFLAACSAVNNNRDKMEYEDVICAFKTFYKLIDADINDLIYG